MSYNYATNTNSNGVDAAGDRAFTCNLRCAQCIAVTAKGVRCKRITCKYLPFCNTHLKSIEGLRVGPSTIASAGDGLFATRDIPVNTSFCKYLGETITKEELEDRYGDSQAPYAITWGQLFLDSACVRSAAAYANDRHPPTLFIVVGMSAMKDEERILNLLRTYEFVLVVTEDPKPKTPAEYGELLSYMREGRFKQIHPHNLAETIRHDRYFSVDQKILCFDYYWYANGKAKAKYYAGSPYVLVDGNEEGLVSEWLNGLVNVVWLPNDRGGKGGLHGILNKMEEAYIESVVNKTLRIQGSRAFHNPLYKVDLNLEDGEPQHMVETYLSPEDPFLRITKIGDDPEYFRRLTNAMFIDTNRELLLKSTRPIAAGAEIFVSYGPTYWEEPLTTGHSINKKTKIKNPFLTQYINPVLS